jgi:hypothetical protein
MDCLQFYPAGRDAGLIHSVRETGYIAGMPASVPGPAIDIHECRPAIEYKMQYNEVCIWQK